MQSIAECQMIDEFALVTMTGGNKTNKIFLFHIPNFRRGLAPMEDPYDGYPYF